MSKQTEQELKDRISELQAEIERKQSALDEIQKKPEFEFGQPVRVVDGTSGNSRYFNNGDLAFFLRYNERNKPYVIGIDIGGRFNAWYIRNVEPIDSCYRLVDTEDDDE